MNRRKPFVIVGLALAATLPLACSHNDSTATESATSSTPTPLSPRQQAMNAGGPTGQTGAPAAGMPVSPIPGAPGAQTMSAPGAAGAKPGAVAKATVPPGGRNKDPFEITWHTPPNPPYVFAEIPPMRLAGASGPTPPPPNTEVREVPTRRVSGIMSGDGVYAILESGGSEPEIVKPGSQTRDGYRVVSINADSVKLQRKEGNLILTQVVPLTDVPSGGARTAGFQGGGFPGSGGFPGGGGGPRMGGGRAGGPGGKLGGGGGGAD